MTFIPLCGLLIAGFLYQQMLSPGEHRDASPFTAVVGEIIDIVTESEREGVPPAINIASQI